MQQSDLPAAVTVSAAAFGIDLSQGAGRISWQRRVGHPLQTDPGGAFVAEHAGRVVGVAAAIRRGRVWILSLLTVEPGAGGRGAGGRLLRAALEYAHADDARLVVSSNHPHALRLYGLAGLRLLPTFEAHGRLDPRALGPPAGADGVADITGELDSHTEELAAVSRQVRGAPHTRELPYAVARGARVLALPGRGFAVAEPGHGVWLLAARDDRAAARLLRAALHEVGASERPLVRWITGAQAWAIDVVLRAGLELVPYGALCVGGEPGPLRPYLPSPPFA
jgi:GNAT superfamily N-acetyltransferase